MLKKTVPELNKKKVYELSSQGPLFNYLKKRTKQLVFSEYFDDVKTGDFKNNIQCQDVQELTFGDNSFDVCTSTEVFEHVPDDLKGFKEIFRVLKAKGTFLLTVPLSLETNTVERAQYKNGRLQHILKPEYHGDNIRGWHQILCFRNYGKDIVQRITSQGFKSVRLVVPNEKWFGFNRQVIIAYKG